MADTSERGWCDYLEAPAAQGDSDLRNAVIACIARGRRERGVPLSYVEAKALELDDLLEKQRRSRVPSQDAFSLEYKMFSERDR